MICRYARFIVAALAVGYGCSFSTPHSNAAAIRSALAGGLSVTDLARSLTAGKIVLTEPRFTLDLAAEPSLENLERSLTQLLTDLGQPAFGAVRIEQGRLALRRDGQEFWVLEGIDADFDLAGAKSAMVGRGTFTIGGQPGAFSFDTRGVPDGAERTAQPAALTFEGGGISLRFAGDALLGAAPSAVGRLKVEVADAAWLGEMLGWPMPKSETDAPTYALSVAGQLNYANHVMAIEEAVLNSGVSSAQGFLSFDVSGEIPKINTSLAFSQLSLSLPSNAHASGPDLTALGGLLEKAIHNVDADIRLSLEGLKLGVFTTGRAAFSIAIRDGKLLADAAEIVVADGIMRGQLELSLAAGADGGTQPAGFELLLRGDAAGVDLAAVSTPLLDFAPVTGIGNAGVLLKAHGASPAELIENLAGEVTLAVPSGGSLGLDLARLVELAGHETLVGWPRGGSERTPFDMLEAQFTLRDGNAYCDRVRMRTGSATLVVDGSVNLAQRRLYMRIDLDALAESVPRDEASETLMLKGPWAMPSIHFEDLGIVTPQSPAPTVPDAAAEGVQGG